MITLPLFLLVLLTLACRETADGNSAIAPLSASLSVVGVTLGFGLLFKAAALGILNAGGPQPAQRCARVRERIEIAWIVALPAALLATGWGPLLNALQDAGMPQAVTLLGWFFPSLIFLSLLELTSAQFEDLCPSSKCLVERGGVTASLSADYEWMGHAAVDENRDASWLGNWLERLRLGPMAGVLACLVPVVLIAALSDVAKHYANDEWLTHWVLIGSLLALATAVLLLPAGLGYWMGVTRLPAGDLRERIERYLMHLNVRGVEVKLLVSHGRWPGAAVVGWFPKFRQLWLGDALIDRLSSRQLDMVIMHELAHLKRRHFLWRLFPILWAAVVLAVLGVLWPLVEGGERWGAALSSITASIVLLGGLSRMAHQCETDADLSACALAHSACEWAKGDPTQPAIELSSGLAILLSDCPQAAKATWLHPSLQRRLASLSQQSRVAGVVGRSSVGELGAAPFIQFDR